MENPTCGNGIKGLNEQCDWKQSSADIEKACQTPYPNIVNASCNGECKCTGCGNGILEPGEMCDGTEVASGVQDCTSCYLCRCKHQPPAACSCTGKLCTLGSHCDAAQNCACVPNINVPACPIGSECKVNSDCTDPAKPVCAGCKCSGWPTVSCLKLLNQECYNDATCEQNKGPGSTCDLSNCKCTIPQPQPCTKKPGQECYNDAICGQSKGPGSTCDLSNCKCSTPPAQPCTKKQGQECYDNATCEQSKGVGSICDLSDCKCTPPGSQSCTKKPGQQCYNDVTCEQNKGPGSTCDLSNCKCSTPLPQPCTKKPGQECYNDLTCENLNGAGSTCDPNLCTCSKVPILIACKNKPNPECTDDAACVAMNGAGSTCNPTLCTCSKGPILIACKNKPNPECTDNAACVAMNGAGSTCDPNLCTCSKVPILIACKNKPNAECTDNAACVAMNGAGSTCDPNLCTCSKVPILIACKNKPNPECTDDAACVAMNGAGSICDPTLCTCSKPPPVIGACPANAECDPTVQPTTCGNGMQCDQLTCMCTPICDKDLLDPNDPLNSTCKDDLFCLTNGIGNTCNTSGNPPTCKCSSICSQNNQPMPLSEMECSIGVSCANPFKTCKDCKCQDICGDAVVQPGTSEECDMAGMTPQNWVHYWQKLYHDCGNDPSKGVLMGCTPQCKCDWLQTSCMNKIGVQHPNCSNTVDCWPGEKCDSLCRCVPDQSACAGKECASGTDCKDDEFCNLTKCECEDIADIPEKEKIPDAIPTHVAESFDVPYDDCMVYPLTFSSDEQKVFYEQANAQVQAATHRTDSPLVETEQQALAICRFGGATIPAQGNPASAQQIKDLKGIQLPDAANNLSPYIVIQDSGSKLLDVQKFMNYVQLTEPLQLLPVAGTADAQIVKGMMVDLASSIPQGVVPMSDASVTYDQGNVVLNNAFKYNVFSITPGQTYTISTAGAPSAQIVAKAEDLPPGTGVAVHVAQIFIQPAGAPFTAPEGYEGLKPIEERKLSLPALIAELQAKVTPDTTPPSEIYTGITNWEPNLNYQFTIIQGIHTAGDVSAEAAAQKAMSLKAQSAGTSGMALKKQFALFGGLPSENIGQGCKCSFTNAAATAGDAIPLVMLLLAPLAGLVVRRVRRRK